MAASRKPLGVTAERLTRLPEIDPMTEHGWRWRTRSPAEFGRDERRRAVWNTKYAGKPAGSRKKNCRPVIDVDGKIYDLRRLLRQPGGAVAAIASQSDHYQSDSASNCDEGILAGVTLQEYFKLRGLSQMTVRWRIKGGKLRAMKDGGRWMSARHQLHAGE
jgi:hypothetical protein